MAFWNFSFSAIYLALLGLSIYILNFYGRLPIEISFLNFLILGLAVFRLTRLFVFDHITEDIRNYFGKFENGAGKTISVLLNCPWCTGIWMALITVFSFYFFPPFSWYAILVIALSGFGTFVDIVSRRIMR